MDELYTIDEVAAILRRCKCTVRRYLRDGELKGIKVGGKNWRVKKSSLDEYLKKED